MAESAMARGHSVRLVAGPTALTPPDGCRVDGVLTAEDMLHAVESSLEWCDALVMSAAVADWRPVAVSPIKLKKDTMTSELALERTPDILLHVRELKGSRVVVGFAAETGDLVPEAERKLRQKGLDLIVANDVTRPGAGFEVTTNVVTMIFADGTVKELPLQGKAKVADTIVAWVESELARRGPASTL